MSRPLIVLRPAPGASSTARAAAAMGLSTIVAPLFEIGAVMWHAPDPAAFDALMLTSANAVRHGGAPLIELRALPAYAVGAATAAAARGAGFTVKRVGDRDAAALLGEARRDGATRLLHLAGREHRDPDADGLSLTRIVVYAAEAVAALPEAARRALAEGATALLHSARAAATFARLCDDAGVDRVVVAIAALSPHVAAAVGTGWGEVAIAQAPTDAALLAAAARLCDVEPVSSRRRDGERL